MPTHKIIVCRTLDGSGQPVLHYLGSGPDESIARRAAFEWIHGRNDYDDEARDGECFDACPRLATELSKPAVGDQRITFQWVTGSLFVRMDGTLDARYYNRADWERCR